MEAATATEELSALRRRVAVIEGGESRYQDRGAPLRFGIPAIDNGLGGGLDGGVTHELTPACALHPGAATGFGLALAAQARRVRTCGDIVWISTSFAAAEAGRPYGLGLEAYGIPLASLLVVQVTRPADVWWAMEEALGCRGRNWLFFGEQHFATDFLYQLEWQRWHKSGVLSRLDLAFSRDQAEKVYVQHRMRETERNLYA